MTAAESHWQPYSERHPGKGKGPGHPVVPEVEATGAVLVALALFLVAARRLTLRRKVR